MKSTKSTALFFTRVISRTFVFALFSAMLCTLPAHAQMVTGSRMVGFDKAFGISAKAWSVRQTDCSLGVNILWPDNEVTFTFFVKPAEIYEGPLKVDVIQYGTKGKPGDWWKPVVFKIADIGSHTIDVDLPRSGSFCYRAA
ncbi:MAG: hypothetical protein A2Z38_09560 [Planctomycetes bacterium RBG_19FT_COMBO_48_8]|nr:MAG: hypothetical protein A2Z38_09560 [Planctomycetes bacterium RBG_19FT_COMBO_48_8]